MADAEMRLLAELLGADGVCEDQDGHVLCGLFIERPTTNLTTPQSNQRKAHSTHDR